MAVSDVPVPSVTGILDGLRVLELGRAPAGMITGMLLADNGADVVQMTDVTDASRETGEQGGPNVVWDRGKEAIESGGDRTATSGVVASLAACADVVIDTRGMDDDTDDGEAGVVVEPISGRHDRVVHCRISGYGHDTPHASRPAIDSLVAARTGLQWDQCGYFGTTMDHVMGRADQESTIDFPVDADRQTGCRDGPIFLAIPWPTMGAALLAVTGISACLLVRERTGRGQTIETSLLQGAMLASSLGWQLVDDPSVPGYRFHYFDRRCPKGLFQCGDGRWLHQWAPIEHEFVRRTAKARGFSDGHGTDGHAETTGTGVSDGYMRQLLDELACYDSTAAAFRYLPRAEWVSAFSTSGLPAQPVLSPEEALLDDDMLAQGVVIEVDDPDHGTTRQTGPAVRFGSVSSNPPYRTRSTVAARRVLDRWAVRSSGPAGHDHAGDELPLAGVEVVDFGLAVAGPFGTQVLAALGARVIKVNRPRDSISSAFSVATHKGKENIALDMKDPRGRRIARQLIARSDVVHHNMRPAAAERLGLDFAAVVRDNPGVVYCHTRAFEALGPRAGLPGNDQLANALAGTAHEAGGSVHGTPPIWSPTGMGDIGNGVLSAFGVLLALRQRDVTGEPQSVETSILNACMLFNSSVYVCSDGSIPRRRRIDAGQYGFSAAERLYETAEGWLAVCATTPSTWNRFCCVLGLDQLGDEATFIEASSPTAPGPVTDAVCHSLRQAAAAAWVERLDDAGVPCEIAADSFARTLLLDPDFRERGWTVEGSHWDLGRVIQVGHLMHFSSASVSDRVESPVTGQHSVEILQDLGYGEREASRLLADGVVLQAQRRSS